MAEPLADIRSTSPEDCGCRLIDLGGSADPRGAINFVEGGADIPFAIRRVFYLHGVREGQRRADHAHYEEHHAIIAVAGRFEALVDDGENRSLVAMDQPDRALYVPPLTWLVLDRFSAGAVCLVLASSSYRADDYCRDYEEFVAARRQAR